MLVIVGIALVIGVLTVFYFTSKFEGFNKNSVDEVAQISRLETVDSLVSKCVSDVVFDTQQEILFSKFYFEELNSAAISPDGLPYFYFAGKILLPEINYVQNQYSSRINPLIYQCLDNFSVIRSKIEQEIILSSENFLSTDVIMEESEITVVVNIDGVLKDELGQKLIPKTVVSVPSKVGTFYFGSQLLLYPPVEDNQAFFEPAHYYLEQNGISLYGRPSGDGIEMIFTMEEKEIADDRSYRLRMSFRLLGSLLDSLSWV